MDREFFTWGNLIVWVVSSLLLYLSVNFRLFMIFHHPEKKLRKRDVFRNRKVTSRPRKEKCGESGTNLGGRPVMDCG